MLMRSQLLMCLLVCAAACSELKGSGAGRDAAATDDGATGDGGSGGKTREVDTRDGAGGDMPDGGHDAPIAGSGGAPGPCSEGLGTRKCDGFAVQECTASGWLTKQSCDNLCTGGACTGVCRPGRDARCAADGKTREPCKDDGASWGSGETCAEACKDGTCVACKPGARRCASKQPQLCDANGSWKDDGAACSTECAAATGLCAECSPQGEKKCVGKAVMVCGAGGSWREQSACTAAQGCIAGACTACDPGASGSQCSGDVVQSCSSTGAWQTQKDCAGSNVSCVAGACAECKVGAKSCSGMVPITCGSDGRWSNGTACGAYCNPADGACKECVPGAMRCTAGVIETCGAEGWARSGDCGGYACNGTGCRNTCTSAADCLAGVKCVGGKCGGKLANGESCSADDECSSNACAPDGVCCNVKCDAVCKTCATGMCTDLVGEDPGQCSGIRSCSSGCKLRDKQPCAVDLDCFSGTCRTYFLDEDGDGFGRLAGDRFCGTTAPATNYKTTGVDCCDKDPAAKPGRAWGPVRGLSACGSGDFNCDGMVEKFLVDWDGANLREATLINVQACQDRSTSPPTIASCQNPPMTGVFEVDVPETACGKQVRELICANTGPQACGTIDRWYGGQQYFPFMECQ